VSSNLILLLLSRRGSQLCLLGFEKDYQLVNNAKENIYLSYIILPNHMWPDAVWYGNAA